MNITEFLQPFDNLLIKINNNKGILILILILLGIYLYQFNEYIIENTTYLFDNNLFRLIAFIIISYTAGSSPAIGISLAIIMLVSMQIITNLKLKKELQNENFAPIEPEGITTINDTYLNNPLLKQSSLNPYMDLETKLITPTDYYMQMIKNGKVLVDDSYDLEQDLNKRFDIREKEIAAITKKNGINLINSGLNRLQKSDYGEYNIINNDNEKQNKFIKYSKILENITDNPSVLASYNNLLYNYDKLISSQLDENNFEYQLNEVYLSELELLETIYKIKKNNISLDNQLLIDNEFTKIKQLKLVSKDWINNLSNISKILE